jgi:NAD+ diphosphatase
MSTKLFVYSGSDLIVKSHEGADGGLDENLAAGLSTAASRVFEWEGRAFRALALDEAGAREASSRGLQRLPLRQAIGEWTQEALRPALKALALLNWISGARYCGACGTALVDAEEAEGELKEAGGRICPACKRPHFPRISPAVIVLVRHEGRALLARNARMPPGGRFGLLAGFVEAGETLEEAAAREVREEAGIEIRNLRYFASQPWPFPDSLMLAFTADWSSGLARPDGVEIAELRWCGPEEMPEIPPRGSVARSLIEAFAAEERKTGDR